MATAGTRADRPPTAATQTHHALPLLQRLRYFRQASSAHVERRLAGRKRAVTPLPRGQLAARYSASDPPGLPP